MKTIFIYVVIILSAMADCSAQKIIRSSLSSFGNAVQEDGSLFRQTIGQPSSTTVFVNENTFLQQGFQQPVIDLNSNSSIEKECTIYLSPNPATDIVRVKFSEEIGANQISIFDMMGKIHFSLSTDNPYYEIDVSKLAKGIYMVNVESKSGYHCNQKLVII
jgi:hypothetical protein